MALFPGGGSFIRRVLALGLVAAALLSVGAQAQRRHRGGPGPFELLQIPEVQRELRLDEGQLTQLRQVGLEMAGRAHEVFKDVRTLSPEERERKRIELTSEWRRRVEEVLDVRQRTRLRQLDLQRGGVRSVYRPDVQDDLKLTPDQRARLKLILDNEREEGRKLFEGIANGSMAPEKRKEVWEQFGTLRIATESRINTVLTDQQKRQLAALQGPPFRFPERRRRPE